jgi:hypothetical protein
MLDEPRSQRGSHHTKQRDPAEHQPNTSNAARGRNRIPIPVPDRVPLTTHIASQAQCVTRAAPLPMRRADRPPQPRTRATRPGQPPQPSFLTRPATAAERSDGARGCGWPERLRRGKRSAAAQMTKATRSALSAESVDIRGCVNRMRRSKRAVQPTVGRSATFSRTGP